MQYKKNNMPIFAIRFMYSENLSNKIGLVQSS